MAFADHPPGLPSLRCRDLNLPQQICIWFIRRAYHAGVEATERTATKVFGPPAMGEALTALDALVDALHRSPLEVPPVHALRAPVQSKEEFDLLTAFAVSQHAGAAAGRALAARWGWPAAVDNVEVEHAVSGFAAFLDRAAQRLPPPQGRPPLACAGADSTADLDPRERSLVRAIRVWVRCVKRREPPHEAVDALLREQGLSTGGRSLNAILTNTATAATRHVDVRCPGCPGLAPDEARIVHAVSAMQRNQQELAFELLASWLQPAAVRLTLPAVEGLAVGLAGACHRLPLRDWRFPELTGQWPWIAAADHSQRIPLH